MEVSKSLIQMVEDVMNLKWAIGLGSNFLLSFLEKSFTVFCESLLMLVTDLTIAIIIPNQKEFLFARVYPVEHSSNPFRYHAFIEFCFQQPSSLMWLFLEVRTLLPDQGNKEKIERVMNSIELALLDRINQPLPFCLRPL